MSQALDDLRQHVYDLRERGGVRRIRLTRDAQVGLERLAAAVRAEKNSPSVPVRAPVAAPVREIRPVAVSEPAKARNIVAWAPAGAEVVQGLPLDAPPVRARRSSCSIWRRGPPSVLNAHT